MTRLAGHEWEAYRDVRLTALEDAPPAFGSRLDDERDRTESEWRARLEHRTLGTGQEPRVWTAHVEIVLPCLADFLLGDYDGCARSSGGDPSCAVHLLGS
ncbi:MAG: hypothetical protein ACXWE5_09060 [Actinomycetota bacterium]